MSNKKKTSFKRIAMVIGIVAVLFSSGVCLGHTTAVKDDATAQVVQQVERTNIEVAQIANRICYDHEQ